MFSRRLRTRAKRSSSTPWKEERGAASSPRGADVLKKLKDRRVEEYIDICVLVLCAIIVVALAVRVLPEDGGPSGADRP